MPDAPDGAHERPDVPGGAAAGAAELARGTPTRTQVVLLGSYVGRVVLALGVTAVLGRSLSPEAFGFFSFVTTIFFVAYTVLDLGSGVMAVREISRDPSRERVLIEGLMGWRRVVGAGIAVSVGLLALLEGEGERRGVLLGVAAVMLLMSPGALYPAFQVRQAPVGPAVTGLATQVVVLAGALVLSVAGVPGPLFAWLVVLRELMNMRVLHVLGVRLLGYRPRPGLLGRGLRPFLTLALLHGLAVLSHTIYFHADVFLVRWIRGEQELGAYAAAFRPINPLLTVPSLLMLPLLPVLSVAAQVDPARFVRHVRRASTTLFGLGALGGVAGVLLAPDLVALLYGGRYLEGALGSVSAFRWLALAFVCVFMASAFTMAIIADGCERVLLVLGTSGVVLNVAGNLAFLPDHGFTAAAVTTAATELFVLLGAALFFLRRRRGALRARQAAILVPAVVLSAVLVPLEGTPAFRVAVGTTLGVLGALAVLGSPGARRLRAELAERHPG